ncbi:ABC transporter permease [Colwellia psychrerythraea]|uniref:MacB-like periplasmic core domain containing protein n=1 Tax=Colwellia psychrerythraea TaxID=28229 RepID=A0A099KFQ4_COLPS|nr:ABC transporter permease [Colwellia psychrerythraea]KGJ89589.1 MacB-like periplasmic core domain containing protein [Colwellia psychrerythraea]
MFLKLAAQSLIHRKGSVILTTLALSISMLVMFSVEHMRAQAKTNFASSVSGVDLIVGARSGELNLLLYSVFRMGKATNNMSWQSYVDLSEDSAVSWAIPISLGDSHQGYRVLGTISDYFEHFSYGAKQSLIFSEGRKLNSTFDVVIGSEVAKTLNYQLGKALTLSHGIGSTSFTNHDDTPFRVIGILEATGTPVDQTIHVSLQGLEVVHLSASKRKQFIHNHESKLSHDDELDPKSITAVMIGLKSRVRAFQLQRKINTSNGEPLMAILPGVALSQLWKTVSIAENTLRVVSALVIVSTLLGLSAMLLVSIRERRQEIKLLRMIGASPFFIYWLIEVEALLIISISTIFAIVLLMFSFTYSKEFLLNQYGLSIGLNVVSINNLKAIGLIFLLTLLAAVPPSVMAFKEAAKKQ